MKTSTKGAIIAAAVAGLFAAGNAMAAESGGTEAKVKCEGINACKGQGACGGTGHSCAGMNECKGKGWVMVGEKECKDKGGTVKK